MGDLLVVRGGETARDVSGDIHRFADGQGSIGDPLAQGLALEQLHHRVGMAVALPDVEDRQDVGVRQRRNRVRFALEARQRLRISGDGRRNNLDRDVAIQPPVARAIDLAHAARAERSDDGVNGSSECPVVSDIGAN